ncbi:MAG: hypothetical protein WCR46_22730 [Deltaproteobacteria bacterium]
MAARLVYGFRIAIFFSLTILIVNYLVGVTVRCAMGYLGGKYRADPVRAGASQSQAA